MIQYFIPLLTLTLAPSTHAICGPGTYAPTVSTCVPCNPGSYAPLVAMTTCLQCGQGTYASAAHSSVCTQCAAGSVQPATGATTCVACASGYAQPNPGRTDCLPVAPSEPCGFGSYTSGYTCVACPYGTYTNTTGAVGESACLACPADGSLLGALVVSQCAGVYALSPDVCARRWAVPLNLTGVFGAIEVALPTTTGSFPEWPAWVLTNALLVSALLAVWYAVWKHATSQVTTK